MFELTVGLGFLISKLYLMRRLWLEEQEDEKKMAKSWSKIA